MKKPPRSIDPGGFFLLNQQQRQGVYRQGTVCPEYFNALSNLGGSAMEQQQHHESMQQCIQNCLECHRICTATMAHVLHGGHSHDEAPHLVALLDCAQMCLLHADFMSRNSPHQGHVAKECAEICTACAVLCDAHPDPDGQMKQCAQACRVCAESCRTM